MSSSSRLGLRARGLLSAGATGPARIAPLFTNRTSLHQANGLPSAAAFTTSQPRPSNKSHRAALEAYSPRVGAQYSPKVESARRMQGAGVMEATAASLSMILPGTFILPPLSQFPKPLGQKLRFIGYWMLLKLQEMVTNAALKYSSKPSFFKRAIFQPKRSALVPTAKALHRSMAEALAAGDKKTLNNICSRRLANPMLASIDARPRGRRYGWELVRYTNKLVYPSIKSHRLSPISRERHAPIIRQAVVAISSKQRRVVYDAADRVIPGSEKEMDVVEHFGIACVIDPKNNWHQSEWRIIGTVQPTTLEAWLEEKDLLQRNLTDE